MIRKPLTVADKVALVILIIITVFILTFWREIFSFLCYTSICKKYLSYQDMIQDAREYTTYNRSNGDRDVTYFTPEKVVTKSHFGDCIYLTGQIYDTEIENTMILYRGQFDSKTYEPIGAPTASYFELYDTDIGQAPFFPYFKFDRKLTFWDLLANFKDIRYITIDEGDFLIYYKNNDNKGRLSRDNRYECSDLYNYITLQVGEVSEEDLAKVDINAENIVLLDYELPNRINEGTITTKLSNCDQEAGTVVSYDFTIPKDENSSLNGFKQDDKNPNIFIFKVTNNITYKKLQERWKGLRDLTDDDFINYSAVIILDKDNSKQIHYKDIRVEEQLVDETVISITEEPANDEYQYSASLVIVPNTMDGSQTPYHSCYYNAEIVNN